jgi:uncharacterized cupredoxin-like copper-binding protein
MVGSGLRRGAVAFTAVTLLTLTAASCGGGGNAVGATLEDFSITLDTDSVTAGSVSFDITNNGPSVHEFVVFATDLPEDQLPTTDEGTVDEEGQGLELVDEVEDIAVDANPTLDVNLDAGPYVVICNVPGHYQQGMHASLTAE